MARVLLRAYSSPFTVQSDFAREEAFGVALAASMGFISTVIGGMASRHWRITESGLRYYEQEAYDGLWD